eukprot:5659295-Amphidinium_carterae.1
MTYSRTEQSTQFELKWNPCHPGVFELGGSSAQNIQCKPLPEGSKYRKVHGRTTDDVMFMMIDVIEPCSS